MSRQSIAKTWIALVIILITVFFIGWAIIDRYFQAELSNNREETKNELLFIASLVKERLQARDYQQAENFIKNWGKKNDNISEVSLITSNGFELAHYKVDKPVMHQHVEKIDLTYSYDGVARLELHKSLDNIFYLQKYFILEVLAGYFFICVIFCYLTYILVYTRKQKHELSLEVTQRLRAEETLAKTNVTLQEREQNLEITLNSIGDAVIATDEKGKVTRMNPVAEQLTGWSFDDAKGLPLKTILPIVDASTREPIENPVEKVLTTGETVYLSNHTLLIAKDGAEYHIADSAAPIRKGENDILGIILVFNDVSERKRAEESIRTLYQAIEQSPVSVMITDADANIEYVNSTFESNTGYSSDEVIGENPRFLKSGKNPKRLYREMWLTISGGNAWQGELLNRKKNGDLFWENAHIAPVLDDSGIVQHYLAVREDITVRKHQEEKILHQAHFDALTDLPNRFLSLDRLSQLINEAQRSKQGVAVLFLDLDDFKKINDTLGHDIGDKLLIEASARLNEVVRIGDTVGRLGGDEFIILLGGLNSTSDAHPVVENLLNRFRDSFKIDSRELMITASVGVALYPGDGVTPKELLRNADSAMYHSKEEGRNTYSYFTNAMNQDVSRRLELEEQMHGALDRNEFSLLYQPKFDIKSRKVIGVEALLRWSNPILGEITPCEFIPIAEQTGLIVEIGEFVLSQAMGAAALWKKQFKQTFSLAVNLSPRQFRDPNLVQFIKQLIMQSGIPSESLELEITEGVLMSDQGFTKQALNDISALGVKIAMDDFGTGYSSLSYLRRYPFDVLKIDRSFVNDITVDAADRELINATIVMAHTLGLKVVAEGVETEAQLAFLAEQGCDIAQGYLFSEPVSADKVTEILQSAADM